MKRQYRLRFLPLALMAALAAGCADDPVYPYGDATLGDFSAETVAGVVNQVLQPIEASADANTTVALIMLQFGLAEQDWDGSIPEQYVGTTVVYSVQDQEWVVDETRTDGPADGLRVVWYNMDSSGAVGVPLSEQGYIDITPGEMDGTEAIGIEIVRTTGATIVLADLLQGVRIVEDAEVSVRELQLEGMYQDGQGAADVRFTTLDSLEIDSASRTYEYDLEVSGTEGVYGWALAGTSDTVSGAYEDNLLISVEHEGASTVLDLDRQGDSPSQIDGTGTVSHDGSTLANVEINANRISFTAPDGEAFTQQARFDLEQLTHHFMLNGATVALALLPLLSLI